MKNYRLKQWYPRIPVYLEDGCVISFDDNTGIATYTFKNGATDIFEMSGAELECTQYWELIEEQEPLFTTEDGVEMLDRYSIVWMVRNKTLEKIKMHSIHLNECDFEHKVFAHESNADEYIWRNKPVFSYEEVLRYHKTQMPDCLLGLAKERIGE